MLSAELKSLTDLASQNPNSDAVLRAVLILLDKASDSDVIVESLSRIRPSESCSQELRDHAARLLRDADQPELAARWLQLEEEPTLFADNVRLFPGTKPNQSGAVGLSFDDIGGLEEVKTQVRRKIIRPFEAPGLFRKFKRKAGGGVLMYGPPGCGKTMLGRAIANECSASFIEVRAADVLDPLKGVAEKRIAEKFDNARQQTPVVLFFDEVEALAQRRQFSGEAAVNTVVSTLLNEMDGFSDNEGILFLGATNIPWSLDSAFRRPGRFDRTIFVPPPDKVARRFILNSLLETRPVRDHLDIESIVDRTSGFSGADLGSLVETAVDFAIEESQSEVQLSPLSNGHFAEALKEVRPSTGEWLTQASRFSEYSNKDGLYDDLQVFLKKYAR